MPKSKYRKISSISGESLKFKNPYDGQKMSGKKKKVKVKTKKPPKKTVIDDLGKRKLEDCFKMEKDNE